MAQPIDVRLPVMTAVRLCRFGPFVLSQPNESVLNQLLSAGMLMVVRIGAA